MWLEMSSAECLQGGFGAPCFCFLTNTSFQALQALADISMLYLHQQEEGESRLPPVAQEPCPSRPDAAGLAGNGMEGIAARGTKPKGQIGKAAQNLGVPLCRAVRERLGRWEMLSREQGPNSGCTGWPLGCCGVAMLAQTNS